jgi:DNA-binding response OmpR family regulator
MTRDGQRVLVVEDEMMVALFLEDALLDLGFEVVGPALHLDDALKLAQEAILDFAILDVNLNGLQSFPVADALRARGIPFLFATGYGTEGLAGRYQDVLTLKKPFKMQEVEKAFAQIAPF